MRSEIYPPARCASLLRVVFFNVFALSHQKKKKKKKEEEEVVSCCKVSFPLYVCQKRRVWNCGLWHHRVKSGNAREKKTVVMEMVGLGGCRWDKNRTSVSADRWCRNSVLAEAQRTHFEGIESSSEHVTVCSGETQSRNSCAGMLALYLYLLCFLTVWCLLCGCSFWSLTCCCVAEPACIVFPAWRTGTGGSTGDRHTNAPYLSWNHTPGLFFFLDSQELPSRLF